MKNPYQFDRQNGLSSSLSVIQADSYSTRVNEYENSWAWCKKLNETGYETSSIIIEDVSFAF